jgi:2-iminoacetate synthase ThiH
VNTPPRSDSTRSILDRAARGDRISRDEALRIYREADLLDMGMAALARRRAIHGDEPVTTTPTSASTAAASAPSIATRRVPKPSC